MIIKNQFFSDNLIFHINRYLLQRYPNLNNYAQNIPTAESITEIIQQFQKLKRLKITGEFNEETFRALGKEMSNYLVDLALQHDPLYARYFILQDLPGGVYLVGTPAERKKLKDIFEAMMEPKQMRYVNSSEMSVAVLGNVTRLFSSGDRFAIPSNEEEWFFCHAMFDILRSPKIVEVRIAESFEFNGMLNVPLIGRVNFGRQIKSVGFNYGGAATANPDESLTGNVQIYLHPKAINEVNSRFQTLLRNRSSGYPNSPLEFTNEMILAHEFGHAYYFIRYDGLVEQGSEFAVRMENVLRSRGTSKLRRTIH